MAELAALEDPKARAVNERHGDDHGVDLDAAACAGAAVKAQQDLARGLWATGDSAARLLDLPPPGSVVRRVSSREAKLRGTAMLREARCRARAKVGRTAR